MANDLERRNNFFDNMMNLRNVMKDDLFSDFVPVEDHMKTDVESDDKGYTVKIDMPGFDKKNIHISYSNNVLTVTGDRDTFDDHDDKEGHILHSERLYGQMSRQYRLPGVNRKEIKAKYNDGVLTISLPKIQEESDDNSRIEIE
ncbi:Hsp20/alpha crystallin family protein [Lactobacillaceae bacterium 24-114]